MCTLACKRPVQICLQLEMGARTLKNGTERANLKDGVAASGLIWFIQLFPATFSMFWQFLPPQQLLIQSLLFPGSSPAPLDAARLVTSNQEIADGCPRYCRLATIMLERQEEGEKRKGK